MSLDSRRLLVALPVFALFCLVAFNVLYRGKAPVCTDSKVVRATAAGSAAQSESFTERARAFRFAKSAAPTTSLAVVRRQMDWL